MPKAKRTHHFVVSGFLLIQTPESDSPSQVTLNSMVRVDTKDITLAVLGKAQQALQLTFHNRMRDEATGEAPEYQILDVIILNMIYCGYMTEADFMGAESALQPKQQAVPSADPFADMGLPIAD